MGLFEGSNWLSVALGMVTKSVEPASNLPMPLMLLPFLGSAIGASGALAVAWCVALTATGYLWARASYNRGPAT